MTAPASPSPTPAWRPPDIDPRIEVQIDQFAAMYPFPLDEFQREAIRTLLLGDSVMVAAPTGTGKTIVAEYGVYEAFRGSGKVIYTTPIKALSNQKYRDLRAIYGDQIGLLTGDVSENRDAQAVVMTTEVLRNMLLQTPWDLDQVDTIIFDEIHFLADPERGTTWEEAIILCPEHIRLICLSATVTNADEIAAWISRTHRQIRLITHTERAVPLSLHYFMDGQLHQAVDHRGVLVRDFPHSGGELRRQQRRAGGNSRRLSERESGELDEPQPREIVDVLATRGLLPAIYFLFSRNDCQAFAERLAVMRPNLVTDAQLPRIEGAIQTFLAALRPEDHALEQVRVIVDLARKGIGYHHAGLLPVLKQLVEVLFTRGLMQVVFATDTLALGVNMPARTVVIGRLSKWDGRRRRMLIANEFQQMAGRAGRRGMDPFGYVVVPYSPWFTFRETLGVATGPLEPVRSAFAIRYNTVLNLWDPPHGDRVRAMLQQSLAQFQTSQRIRQLEEDIVEIGGDIAGVPSGCLIGLDGGDELLEDYRRLTTTFTTAQQRERRALKDLDLNRQQAGSPPWTEPGRQALRRVFRDATPGIVVHHRDLGWVVWLGRGDRGGVGLFLHRKTIVLVPEYKSIDFIPEKRTITLPVELIEPPTAITDATERLPANAIDNVWRKVRRLGLPDLAGMEREHQEREAARIAADLAAGVAEWDDAAEQTRLLHHSRDTHPCHSCPRRKEHRDNLASVERLDKERGALGDIHEREIDAEEARIRGVIRGIRDVLHRFGYLHRGYPTAKADMLADVFDNDGLVLCEAVDQGILDQLSPEQLAEVFSWFSFDRDFRYNNHLTLDEPLVQARRRLEDLEHAILGEERDAGLAISEGHNATFYGAARAWCQGRTMAEITRAIELSEGDLVLTFNKTIDLMRQVRDMLTNVAPGNPLRYTLAAAEGLLRRGIVEQSLQVGFNPIVSAEQTEPLPERAPALPEPVATPATATKPARRRKTSAKLADPAPPTTPPTAELGAAAPTRRTRRKPTPDADTGA